MLPIKSGEDFIKDIRKISNVLIIIISAKVSINEKLEGLKKLGVVREVRGKGLLRGVELVKDTQTLKPFPELGIALKQTSLNNGIILRINPDWFAVAPALIAEEGDIDEMVELIEKSLNDALEIVGR